MTRLALWVVVAFVPLLAAPGACQPIPQPEPIPVPTGGAPGTGGASWATGGAFATGGTAGTGGVQPTEAEFLCWHLAMIGCPEGDDPTCPRQIENIRALGSRAVFDMDCLLLANTPAQARDCESILCGGDQ